MNQQTATKTSRCVRFSAPNTPHLVPKVHPIHTPTTTNQNIDKRSRCNQYVDMSVVLTISTTADVTADGRWIIKVVEPHQLCDLYGLGATLNEARDNLSHTVAAHPVAATAHTLQIFTTTRRTYTHNRRANQ